MSTRRIQSLDGAVRRSQPRRRASEEPGAKAVKNAKHDLYDDLRTKVLTMELAPGLDLDEVALSETYGLSRTPVRETLRRLAGEGYLEIRENRGARVAPMDHTTLRNFFLVAPMVYAAIGRLAVQNFQPSQLIDLKNTQQRFRAASESRKTGSMVLENNRFHEIMGEMSGSIYLRPSLSRLLIDHARIGHTFFRPRDPLMERNLQLATQQHDGFIAALISRDEPKVVELVFAHWELSRENMEVYIAPEGLKPDALVDGVTRPSTER
jgi:DNA-binding GntR family transcriptional regulator